jgi:hypothetical protein
MIQSHVQKDLGRAKNALQKYLVQKLLIPKIYLDAEWNGVHLDVLAIDRAGVGDVHAVLFVERTNQSFGVKGAQCVRGLDEVLAECIEELRSLPCQFRDIAIYDGTAIEASYAPSANIVQRALADDGVGRVGILYVDLSEDDPTVRVLLKPERFRSSKEIVELADRYVAEHTANWEVRE